jgi:hypothetical protein
VWFARFDDQAALDRHPTAADPATTVLELAPTSRSRLR